MAKITLGGKNCEATTEIAWTYSDGVSPGRAVVNLSPADAKALFDSGEEVSLVIVSEPDGRREEFKRLTVMGYEPTAHPEWASVQVADLRWKWARAILSQGFNVPIRTGFRRVAAPGEPPELQDVADEPGFARWSLKVTSGTTISPWRADEILEEVLSQMPGIGKIEIESDVRSKLSGFPVEDLLLEGNAAVELQKVLEFLPEVALTVDADGTTRAYSKASGAEVAAYLKALPEEVAGGHVILLDNRNLRPVHVDIYIPFEFEIRHDYEEAASGGTQAQIGDRRLMENVIPVPDHTLTLASGKVVCQGTWITVDEAFAAWRAEGGVDAAFWTHDLVQKGFVGWLDFFGAMDETGNLNPNADVLARIDAVREHYRQTFRLNPRWREAFLTTAAYRVAIIDPTQKTRAKSPVYADHCKIPSMRGKWKSIADRGKMYPFLNHPSGLSSATAPITGDVEQAPAIVTVVDSDQGIIRISYATDIYRQASAVLPSLVENGPTVDFTQAGTANVLWDSVREGQGSAAVPKLAARFKLTTILSHTPAGPNNKNRFFRIRVRPSDIASFLPGSARAQLGNAKGPPYEIIYRGDTARGAWVDSAAERIERLFGVGRPVGQGQLPVDDLIVNYGPTTKSGGASLRAVALSLAAQVYAEFADGLSGEMVGRMTPGIKMGGRLARVAYHVETDGNCTTRLAFEPSMPKPSIFEMLDPATKKAVAGARIPI